ncbi:alpha/beta fold hydrolase [Actinoallomurus acanthiterrae]
MTKGNDSASWVRRFHPSPDANVRLVCFAHAGGSASYFHPVSAALAPLVDVLAVQYPGRQDRRAEPTVTDLRTLAERVGEALLPWVDLPMIFFGHSMGALVAYETARLLESRRTPLTALFVSGRRSPTTVRDEAVHVRGDAALLKEVRRLGGTDLRLLANDELVKIALPALRGDYQAVETYRYRPGPPLRCPITALIGDRDPKVTVEEATDWKRHTVGGFDLRVLPGGHFYLNDHKNTVLEMLAATARA